MTERSHTLCLSCFVLLYIYIHVIAIVAECHWASLNKQAFTLMYTLHILKNKNVGSIVGLLLSYSTKGGQLINCSCEKYWSKILTLPFYNKCPLGEASVCNSFYKRLTCEVRLSLSIAHAHSFASGACSVARWLSVRIRIIFRFVTAARNISLSGSSVVLSGAVTSVGHSRVFPWLPQAILTPDSEGCGPYAHLRS